MNQIVMIPIERIKPHPHNPRQELGDLTELADSIKSKGIMQNLTVVDDGDGSYTAVIGHRRLAAAKQAGLTEVPCAIAEMDEGEQLATMLLENMQRSDLTVYEQAEGVQLLLDMDFSVADIAQKTGFSESTVRRRAKLTTLDKKKFKASQARQVSLSDYEKLFEIEDEETRNKLLDKIGTADYYNEIKIATAAEKAKRNIEDFKQQLQAKGVRILKSNENPYTFSDYAYFDYYIIDEKPRELKLTSGEFIARINNCNTSLHVTLFRKVLKSKSETEKEAEIRKGREEREAKDRQFRAEAAEINDRMESLRKDFINNFSIEGRKSRKSQEDLIIKSLLEELCVVEHRPDVINYDEDGDPVDFERVYESDGGIRIMLSILEYSWGGKYIREWNRNNAIYEREDVADLNRLYYLLTRLGYEMCDEEKQLRDGTHEIYTKYKD